MERSKIEKAHHPHHDIESHGHNEQTLCMKLDNSDPQWAFIRKVYAIIAMQLLLTAAVAAAVVFYRPIPHFFAKTTPGLVAYIFIIIFTILST